MDIQTLLAQLGTLSGHRSGTAAFGPAFILHAGLETRQDPRRYYWDGMKRGGDPEHPSVVIQYTLAGSGAYQQAGRTLALPPAHCFIAPIPSPHCYYLPDDSPSWTFFWLLTTHDYVTRRFTEMHRRFSPVLPLPPDSAPITRMAGILQGVCSAGFRDDLAAEQALLDFTLEYERYARAISFPTHRQSLLDEVRHHLLGNLNRQIEVEELASAAGMSRSHYSHYFRATTGLSPAQYMTEVRLHEVARRLTQTREPLKVIARATGFADANHLCKVFRRHFHTSPGQFRRHVT